MVTYKELLVKVVQKLEKNNIDYYLTGSMAVELYAGRHIVSDIDIVIKREDLDKLKKLFFIKEVKRKNKYGVFRSLKYNRNRIEFTFFDDINKNGKKYSFEVNKERLRKCRRYSIDGQIIKVISPEELITLKLLLDRNTKGKHDKKDALSVYEKMKINKLELLKLGFKYGVLGKTIDLMC